MRLAHGKVLRSELGTNSVVHPAHLTTRCEEVDASVEEALKRKDDRGGEVKTKIDFVVLCESVDSVYGRGYPDNKHDNV